MEDKGINMEITKVYLAIILIGFLTILWYKSRELTRDKVLENKIEYLKENLGYPKSNFTLSLELKKLLLDRNFDPMSIRKLVSCIMSHFNISMFGVDVIIDYDNEKLYINNEDKRYDEFIRNEIRLNIKSYYTLYHVIALISYKCTDYYINYKGISISKDVSKEILLEIAAVYLGFGEFISKAHAPVERVLENRRKDNTTVIIKEVSIIGILNESEINYIVNRISELKLLSILKGEKLNKNLITKKNI